MVPLFLVNLCVTRTPRVAPKHQNLSVLRELLIVLAKAQQAGVRDRLCTSAEKWTI